MLAEDRDDVAVMSLPDRRYSTGLTFLDYRLDGGIPVGTLLALTAPADSQSELLFYHFATSQPMVYLSTNNPAEIEVRAAMETSSVPEPVDFEFRYLSPEDLLDDPGTHLSDLRTESFVVVDPVDGLERHAIDRYLPFVDALKRRLRETDSVGVVHALDTDPVPDGRRVTLKRADHVWRLEQLVHSREITNRLLVTKARRGRALSEPIQLRMDDHIEIDTSQRIA